MAGLDDYQFFTNLREKESPFWQKPYDNCPPDVSDSVSIDSTIRRPTNFPQTLHGTPPASLPISIMKPHQSEPHFSRDPIMEKYGEVSINLISLCAENLLSHPFIVLRRQCQVNVSSKRYHILPITLVPTIIHLQGCQGISVFWKGLGSILTVKGVTLGLEDCISKFTPWPKEISPHSSLKTIGQHLMLKSVSLALITPFYSASLVETVQSEIASERPGVFDVFKEGLMRVVSFTQPQTGRMLPVWLLIGPTVIHGVLQYLIRNAISTITSQALRTLHKRDQKKQGAVSKDSGPFIDASVRLQAAFIGHLATDVILYPLETILHRLHLQGTRTIIDSLDAGYEVKPMLTRYEGFFDCLTTSINEEGILGLFKGFGSLCLQYALYGAVLKFAHIIIREVTVLLVPPKPQLKPQTSMENDQTDSLDLVKPLAPTAPYTSNVQQQPPFQSSPLMASSHHNDSLKQPDDHLSYPEHGLSAAAATKRRLRDLDFRAEAEKHNNSHVNIE